MLYRIPVIGFYVAIATWQTALEKLDRACDRLHALRRPRRWQPRRAGAQAGA